jgi:hypothetical protein
LTDERRPSLPDYSSRPGRKRPRVPEPGPPLRPRPVRPRTVNSTSAHPLLAARIVTGSLVNNGYFTIRKDGLEARRLIARLCDGERYADLRQVLKAEKRRSRPAC